MQKACLILLCLFPLWSWAQQQGSDTASEQAGSDPLKTIGSEYHNGIRLLQNRFRIDYKVDEITMVFFREYGSIPVVLVRPDGSKIFQAKADGENVFWYDTATYDMISIKNPMPGPWQAVGQILPDSRVMVLSDIQLHAEPLPDIVFSGEILKQTAYLTNGGAPINYSEFRDVVNLRIQFFSTNNPNYTNFGADNQTVATFEDNGKGMDEVPLDGVYTGQFNLAISNGEWKPVFIVSTPMFTREQVQPVLMLHPNPIQINVELNGGGGGYHKLLIDADREFVDMNTLLIDGKIRFPNGDIQNFSITDVTDKVREHLIVNYEYGVFRVKLTAYGNTVDGRDFILDVPEYTFLSEEPSLEGITALENVLDDVASSTTETPATTSADMPDMLADDRPMPRRKRPPEPPEEPEMSTTMLVSLVVGVNGVILCMGGVFIWLLTREKKSKGIVPADPATEEKVQSKEMSPSIIARITSVFSKKKKRDEKKEDDPPPPEN